MKWPKNPFEGVAAFWRPKQDALRMRFHSMPRRTQRLAMGVFFGLALILIEIGVIEPMQRSILELDKKIQLEEKKSLTQVRSMTMKPAVDEAYLRLLQNMDSSGGDEEIRASMLHDIENFARAENMDLAEVKPQVSTERGSLKEFSVRMQADGNLHQLVQFFVDLVRTRRLYTVESFRIAPHPEDVNKIRANVSITRVAFAPEAK